MKKTNLLSIGLAIVFLIVGLVVLSDLLGFLKANNIFGIYWPIVLVIIAIFSFGATGSNNGFAFGMIILGILLTLRNLNVFASQSGEMIFIVLIVLSGLAVLVMSTEKKSNS
jgi:hypothetical protein